MLWCKDKTTLAAQMAEAIALNQGIKAQLTIAGFEA